MININTYTLPGVPQLRTGSRKPRRVDLVSSRGLFPLSPSASVLPHPPCSFFLSLSLSPLTLSQAEVYSPVEEQERWLSEAQANVKKYGYFMRKALDEDNLREALRFSAAMLGELRTSLLSPQRYYELYMRIFDELRDLEAFFADATKRSECRPYRSITEPCLSFDNSFLPPFSFMYV
jgi:hypothetical protein